MAPVSMSTSESDPKVYSSSDLRDIETRTENQIEETDELLEKDGACWESGSQERENDQNGACWDGESLKRENDQDGACRDGENLEREGDNQDSTCELDGSENKDNDNISESDEEKGITVDENQAPDGGWGWFIVLGALLLRSVIGGIGKSHGLFFIQFKKKFNGTATTTALVTSLTCFIRLSAGPFVSILSGRFQCRNLTFIGAVALFIGIILTGFGRSLHFLYFSYGVVAGLGRALTLTPVPIQLGYYFNKRKSLAFGLASAGFSIGGFAITPIVELLFQHYGYQGTFLILSGFALNVLVSAALFRPIELHKRLTAKRRNTRGTKNEFGRNTMELKSKEEIESETASSSSSTSSINGDKNPIVNNPTMSCHPQFKSVNSKELCRKLSEHLSKENKLKNLNGDATVGIGANHHNNGDVKDEVNVSLLSNTSERKRKGKGSYIKNSNQTFGKRITGNLCCLKGKGENEHTITTNDNKKKIKLISWSVLKDTRFLCFVLATFCFTLPTTTLFLPSLAKTRGLTDIQAATLLSVSAGCDTVFRVMSGFVLDFKIFRSHRPLIYNIVTFLQAVIAGLFPLMTNFSEFIMLCILEGLIAGVRSAQGAVIMIDMLGIDKLASSLAVTMTVQCAAVFLGPAVSGQLIDRYGTYDGAFYFGAGAILVGVLVMGIGNIVNHCKNARAEKKSENS